MRKKDKRIQRVVSRKRHASSRRVTDQSSVSWLHHESEVSGANFSSDEDSEFFDYDPAELRLNLLRERIEKEKIEQGQSFDSEKLQQ